MKWDLRSQNNWAMVTSSIIFSCLPASVVLCLCSGVSNSIHQPWRKELRITEGPRAGAWIHVSQLTEHTSLKQPPRCLSETHLEHAGFHILASHIPSQVAGKQWDLQKQITVLPLLQSLLFSGKNWQWTHHLMNTVARPSQTCFLVSMLHWTESNIGF